MNGLDPAALDCLAALADNGSFDRAAERLAITQSAVSQRLRTLEGSIGQPLVVPGAQSQVANKLIGVQERAAVLALRLGQEFG